MSYPSAKLKEGSSASDMGPVAILLGPFDCVVLGLEARESVIRVGFDYILLDTATLLASMNTFAMLCSYRVSTFRRGGG